MYQPFKRLSIALLAGMLGWNLVVLAAGFEEEMSKGAAQFSHRNFRQAARHYNNALSERPGHADAMLGLGLALFENGDIEAALSQTQSLRSLHPNHAPAYLLLGRIYERQGQTDMARQAFLEYVTKAGGKVPPDPQLRLKLRQYGVF